jgi:hypothetical protein
MAYRDWHDNDRRYVGPRVPSGRPKRSPGRRDQGSQPPLLELVRKGIPGAVAMLTEPVEKGSNAGGDDMALRAVTASYIDD